VGVVSDTALASRPGVSPHAVAASASASVAKEMAKDAVIPMHSISASLYVKGLTYQHILSVDMFTKEQVCSQLICFFVSAYAFTADCIITQKRHISLVCILMLMGLDVTICLLRLLFGRICYQSHSAHCHVSFTKFTIYGRYRPLCFTAVV